MSVRKRMLKLRTAKGMDFGPGRTRALLDALGSPDEKLKIIHVAGTNGKGSVSQYISHILAEAGEKCGTFTSPEIYDYYDQYRINCRVVKIRGQLRKVIKRAEVLGATEFEISFCAAMLAFASAGCAYAVVECGMGGLNDATNAVRKKEAAVISSVSLEHTRYLGGTVEEICAQKYGIVRGCPAVVSALQNKEARAFFDVKRPVYAGEGIEIIRSDADGQTFRYGGKIYNLKTAGFAQPYNAACAIEVAKLLGVSDGAIERGLSRAQPYGRIEVLRKKRATYILDGGHNPAAVKPLAGVLAGKKAKIIYGCLSDKDVDGVVRELAPCAESFTVVKCPGPRAMDVEKIFSVCNKYCENTRKAESLSAALEKSGGLVVVCGSFTLLKEAKKWIGKRS